MMENEMLKIAVHCLGVQAEQEVCEECPVYRESGIVCKEIARTAISALEEIQQYRKIGSVGEIKQAIGVLSLSENDIIKTFHELNEYHKIGTVEQVKNQKENLNVAYQIISDYESIGTVEECREAVEKQKAKKPEWSDSDFDYYKCPVCGEYICATDNINDHNYCLNCGQAIDWEESEE